MIGIEKPFTVSSSGELVINEDMIRGIEPFQSLLKRQTSTRGDSEGRKKLLNIMEMKYIYFMCDWNTYHRGLPTREQNTKAKEDAGLPTSWKPDELVTDCMKKYAEIMNKYIPSARLLISMEKGLAMSSIAIDSYTSQMERIVEMNTNTLNTLDSDEFFAKREETLALNKIIQENISEIMKIGKEMPKVLDGVADLVNRVRKEQGEAKKKLQGDRIKRNREDPKNLK